MPVSALKVASRFLKSQITVTNPAQSTAPQTPAQAPMTPQKPMKPMKPQRPQKPSKDPQIKKLQQERAKIDKKINDQETVQQEKQQLQQQQEKADSSVQKNLQKVEKSFSKFGADFGEEVEYQELPPEVETTGKRININRGRVNKIWKATDGRMDTYTFELRRDWEMTEDNAKKIGPNDDILIKWDSKGPYVTITVKSPTQQVQQVQPATEM